jgi:hypothetical protein
LLSFVREKNLVAAGNFESTKDGILALHWLNNPARVNATFLSNNHIKNVIRNSRRAIGRVCRWNPKSDQLTRWMRVALLCGQMGFRRVLGHKEFQQLKTVLGPLGSSTSPLHHLGPARESIPGWAVRFNFRTECP